MTEPIRVLLVDDRPRARQSLRALLRTLPAAVEFDEVENGLEALERVEHLPPDIVLFDLRIPRLNGLDAARLIKQRAPSTKVIVLSLCGDVSSQALAAGADAFVCKTESPERLLKTVAGVMSG